MTLLSIRQLFRPIYGGKHVTVRPRRWWSPHARKSARIAAKIVDQQTTEPALLVNDVAIYGVAITDQAGRRVDPNTVRPTSELADPEAAHE
jgi:hypothetical protein